MTSRKNYFPIQCFEAKPSSDLLKHPLNSRVGALVSDLLQKHWRYQWNMIYGEREIPILKYLCDKDRDSIDVGANVGNYSCVLARHSRHLVAFEPVPWDATRLKTRYKKITVHPVALSDEDRDLTLRIPAIQGKLNSGLASIVPPSTIQNSEDWSGKVQGRRLDSIYGGDVGFIKIDVEGHEAAVLGGALATIRRCRPNALVEAEERHSPGSLGRVGSFFSELNYKGFFIYKDLACDIKHFNSRLQQIENVENFPFGRIPQRNCMYINNFIFVPNERFDQVLLRLGCRISCGELMLLNEIKPAIISG